MKVLGIDEAGRGCVFGDLVIAAFAVEDPDELLLRDAGADDSKAMSLKKRSAAREKLRALGTPDVRCVSPTEIDNGNLNTLEEAVIIDLVNTHEPDHVFVDALGHPSTLGAVTKRLIAGLKPGLNPTWTIEPKADSTYAVVGAASIFAKTTRDEALEALKATHGELGSGYPSDPKVKAWLVAHHETGEPWPPFVRTRWATVQNLSQPTLL